MIRQILAQPLVPGKIDLKQSRHMSIIAAVGFNQSDDTEINLGEMRIGAEIIPHDHDSFRLKLGHRLFHLILRNIEPPQQSHQLRGKPSLLAAAPQNLENRFLSIR